MNNYNGEPMFLDPKVEQYGSHMIMSNVTRPRRTTYATIDTQFGDNYTSLIDGIITVSLPDKLCDVASIKIVAAEIPISFYNISKALGNNCFGINVPNLSSITVVTIADGYYTIDTIATAVNTALALAGVSSLSYSITNHLSVFTPDGSINGTYIFQFDTDSTGVFDKYNFKSKFGWLMGFREQAYSLVYNTTLTSPSIVNTNFLRYLYITVDDFSGSARPAMQCAVSSAHINKRVLARVGIDSVINPFGSVLVTNTLTGMLVSDKRVYVGKTDIQRLCLQLVSSTGVSLNLNGLDFSFVLEIEHN